MSLDTTGMNRQARRDYMKDSKTNLVMKNAAAHSELRAVPKGEWPNNYGKVDNPPLQVFRSRGFLVQVYSEQFPALVRLSIHRTMVDRRLQWVDGITWDELQRLKGEAGYGDHQAIEFYPPDIDVVNVANIRHLWVMQEPLPFAWKRVS